MATTGLLSGAARGRDAGANWSKPIELPYAVGMDGLYPDFDGAWHPQLVLSEPGSLRLLWHESMEHDDGEFLYEIRHARIANPAPTDLALPSVSSVEFAGYAAATKEASFNVNFSEPVGGFGDTADLDVIHVGTAHTSVSYVPEADAQTWHLALQGFSGEGTVRLFVNQHAVADLSGNELLSVYMSEAYPVDGAAPGVKSVVRRGTGVVTGGNVVYDLTIDEAVSGFDAHDVAVDMRGTSYARVTVSGSGDTYVVTIIGVRGDGWMRMGIGSALDTHDAAGNSFAGTTWAPGLTVNTTTDHNLEGEPEGATDAADAMLVALLQGFYANDLDQNRSLDWGEVLNIVPGFPGWLFEIVDTNIDAHLSIADVLNYRGQGYIHGADTNGNGNIAFSELLRVVQLYNANGYDCVLPFNSSEDGFVIPSGDHEPGPMICMPHTADYFNADNRIQLSELLRIIQLFHFGQIDFCADMGGEDQYCGGP